MGFGSRETYLSCIINLPNISLIMKKWFCTFCLCLLLLPLSAQKKVFPFYQQVEGLGSRWGIVDEAGKILQSPSYEYLSFFVDFDQKDAFALFKQEQKWGIVDRKGNIVLDPTYEEIKSLNGGRALRVKQEGKYGLYHVDQQKLIAPIDYNINIGALDSLGRYFQVVKEGQIAIVNEQGEFVVPADSQFFNVMTQGDCPVFMVVNRGNITYVNCEGKKVPPVISDYHDEGTLDDLSLVSVSFAEEAEESVNFFGERELPPGEKKLRDGVKQLHGDSLEVVKLIENESGDQYATVHSPGGWGIVDSVGQIFLPPIYKRIRETTYYGYQYYQGRKFGLVDLDRHRIVTEPIYWNVERAFVKLGNIPQAQAYWFLTTQEGLGGCMNIQTGKWYVPK